MKKTFEEFIDLINKSTDRDPWVRDTNIEGYCQNIEIEARELIDAMKTRDYEHIKEELGDVLMDWAACKLAEEQGLFTLKDVLDGVNDKIKRRKPYVLDAEKKEMTKEEAVRIWKEVKKKEKEEKLQRLQKSQTLK